MSKRSGKQNSSNRGAGFGGFGGGFGSAASPLSYVAEPPDLSPISDPNVVVAFKNLLKKDSTTKAKALEDLQAFVTSANGPIEDSVLNAWVTIYPRTSIDSSRIVRQRAHALQGHIATSSGKRIARYMPQAVGAWISGLYDNDRAASKSAQEALQRVFSTPEKLIAVRKAYQQSILDYCHSAITKETVETLSDERTTSRDDAEQKYGRVIAASLSVITSLLDDLAPEDIAKHQDQYDDLWGDSALWDMAAFPDPTVRRSLCRLLRVCLTRQAAAVEKNLDAISKSLLAKALDADQFGSLDEFIATLIALTQTYPTLWTDHYKSKKPVGSRLRKFLKLGSQGGTPTTWANMEKLLRLIPAAVLPSNAADLVDLLNALHNGIIRKEEPRPNYGAAYRVYVRVAASLVKRISDEDQIKVFCKMVLPILEQYLHPELESQWAMPGPHAGSICAEIMRSDAIASTLQRKWPEWSENLIKSIKTSLPEQSRDYRSSQDAVMSHALRWVSLQAEALKMGVPEALHHQFQQNLRKVVAETIGILRVRNGKPYGAAGLLESALSQIQEQLLDDPETAGLIISFVRDDLPLLYLSPSQPQLTGIIYSFSSNKSFSDSWTATLETILASPEDEVKRCSLKELLSSPAMPHDFKLPAMTNDLQSFIIEEFKKATNGETDWSFLDQILKRSQQVVSAETADRILDDLMASLSVPEKARFALQGLEHISRRDPLLLKHHLLEGDGSALVRNLLVMTESPDEELAERAASVNASIQLLLSEEQTGTAAKSDILFKAIRKDLQDATPQSSSIETLVDFARNLWQDDSLDRQSASVQLLPLSEPWDIALRPFLNLSLKTSMSVTNMLGGAVYLIESTHPKEEEKPSISRDNAGLSTALRMALYTAEVIQDSDIFCTLPSNEQVYVACRLLLTLQLASDNLGFRSCNDLWNQYTPENEEQVLDYITRVSDLLKVWLQRGNEEAKDDRSQCFINGVLDTLRRNSLGLSPAAFNHARVYCMLQTELIELRGWQGDKDQGLEDLVKNLRRSTDDFLTIATLVTHRTPFSQTKATSRYCNELVADLTGMAPSNDAAECLRKLVLLNTVMCNHDGITETIAKQRLVFFVQHTLPWLSADDVAIPLKAETCRALSILLPLMKDIYGAYWTDTLSYMASLWSRPQSFGDQDPRNISSVPLVHASLKLYGVLRTLSMDENANDDLVDAWKESERAISSGLLELLSQAHTFSDTDNQPLRIVNELLARQISKLDITLVQETTDLFPLLYVESDPVQRTAFDILHQKIPMRQEQISIDAALENKTAQLPFELLSLLTESPVAADIPHGHSLRHLRGYLLSWLLVFDHFRNSSYKVKMDYIEQIKEGDYLPQLLDFMFEYLGHASGKPVDASTFDVTSYTPDTLESDQKDTQWLLAHLWYLCLQNLSSVAKSWWLNSKRQTNIAVETWTEKFISPHVISSALDSVSEWAASQDHSADEALAIKVNQRSREVTASYEVDEQKMMIVIRLPGTYPLKQAVVEGINRVAVTEKQWQSWLMSTAGVITFSNGNLVDGLIAWRKNIVGAMKGQTECAICYSIINSDKQLPSKRCSTCKNLFHSSCLFKWFKTSNGSSCPLCRNAFNYG